MNTEQFVNEYLDGLNEFNFQDYLAVDTEANN